MKPKLLICWRYFPEYRKEIIQKLSHYFDVIYFYGEANKDDSVIQIEKLDGIKLIKHKVTDILGGFLYLDFAFYSAVKNDTPDYVVIQPTPRDLSIFFKLLWCRFTKTKVIGWGMGKMPGRNKIIQTLHDFLVFLVLIQLDKMICYSTTSKDYYKKIRRSLKCEVIVNTKSITDNEIDSRKITSEPKETINIVFVGRLIDSKNIDELVKACNLASETVKVNVALHIIGVGPSKNSLVELCDSLNVDATFYGFKRDSDLFNIMKKMDIFVLPSLGGLAIIDALYSSLPIISGPADGTEKDLVLEGYNGFTLDTVSSVLIANKISKIHRENLYRMGDNSKKLYIEKFHIDKFITNFVKAVKE